MELGVLASIGYGLATIGPGIGIGISFAGNSGRYAIKQIAENIG